MKLAWATDIHLSHATEAVDETFCADIAGSGAEALLLGGDIAEANNLETWLHFVSERVRRPVYFVLGNHDYYGSDVASVRARMRTLDASCAMWLPHVGVVELSEHTALVGHGGWGDARFGNFDEPVLLSDYFTIQDLRESSGSDNPLAIMSNLPALKRKLGELGDDAARTLLPFYRDALERFDEVLVLTHVPPFREACWHQARISEDAWLPGFTCKAMAGKCANPSWKLKRLQTLWFDDVEQTTSSRKRKEPRWEVCYVRSRNARSHVVWVRSRS